MSSLSANKTITTLLFTFVLAIFSTYSLANPLLLLSKQEVVETLSTDGLLPGQVGDFVAPLSEYQVRALLIENLREQASLNNARQEVQSMSFISLLKGATDPESPLGRGIFSMINASHDFWQEVDKIFITLVPGGGVSGIFKMLLILTIVTLLAYAIEWLCIKRWRKTAQAACLKRNQEGESNQSSYPFLHFAISIVGLIIFAVAGHVLLEIFSSLSNQADSINQQLAGDGQKIPGLIVVLVESIVALRFFTILFTLVIAPSPKGMALIDDRINHKILFLCMGSFTFVYILGTRVLTTFVVNGLGQEYFLLAILVLFGLIINPIIFWFVWTQRRDVDRIMFGTPTTKPATAETTTESTGYAFATRAMIWPAMVTFVITLAFFNWVVQARIGNKDAQAAIELAWWITLSFPIIDLLVSSLLLRLVSLSMFQNISFQRRKQRFIYVTRSLVRLLLLTILVLSFLDAWGFNPLEALSSATGINILSSTVDIGATILLGFIIWEAIQLWMERLMPDEPEEDAAETEGEGGGAAATRSQTVLPLFKTILLILLSVIVVMSVLYSLGVQIGPLLAGASVVGIAIGFGSQKLVQDIISGMFFLIDDAFRIGEYVHVAGLKGTIEKLSMRSMRLRHHLGAVQTVPYGEINTVKNLSRDWVIMKLELRLPYDVDIEKVRKIIKKVGQKMLEDEVTGPYMLQPLKSQGVMRVEESALIFRMKFTAKPGEQWVVRRVAYTNVRNALAEAGIEFAHREIKVRLPDDLVALHKLEYQSMKEETEIKTRRALDLDRGVLTGAVNAAAMSAVMSSELAKQNKIDDNDVGDE